MAFEQRNNSGACFTNKKKTQINSPDYTGVCKVGGVEYYASTWIKKDKNGNDFLSYSFKRKDQDVSKGPDKKAYEDVPF